MDLITIVGILLFLVFVFIYCKKPAEEAQPTSHRQNEAVDTEPLVVQESLNIDGKILDLHSMDIQTALKKFKSWLKEKENEYFDQGCRGKDRFVTVVTGQGNHSPDNQARIKPAVQQYLNENGIGHEWLNPGYVKIDFSA